MISEFSCRCKIGRRHPSQTMHWQLWGPVRAAEEEQRADPRMKLVGAVFITPEKFDGSLGKKGLDEF